MGFGISRRPVRIHGLAAAVLLGVLTGCGSATPRLLDESARAVLHAQVEDIRSALGDRTRAMAAVERFRAEVRRLREGGDLAAADADVLLAHADRIETRIRAESPLPRPTPVVVQPPRDVPKEPVEDRTVDAGRDAGKAEKKADKNQGKGKKKGRGG